jgi:hypothetical protein
MKIHLDLMQFYKSVLEIWRLEKKLDKSLLLIWLEMREVVMLKRLINKLDKMEQRLINLYWLLRNVLELWILRSNTYHLEVVNSLWYLKSHL